jgi:hypothetical protein
MANILFFKKITKGKESLFNLYGRDFICKVAAPIGILISQPKEKGGKNLIDEF